MTIALIKFVRSDYYHYRCAHIFGDSIFVVFSVSLLTKVAAQTFFPQLTWVAKLVKLFKIFLSHSITRYYGHYFFLVVKTPFPREKTNIFAFALWIFITFNFLLWEKKVKRIREKETDVKVSVKTWHTDNIQINEYGRWRMNGYLTLV